MLFASLSALVVLSSTTVSTTSPAPLVTPPAAYAPLYDIGSGTSPQRLEQDVRRLVGFGTRHTLSAQDSDVRGIGAATRWLQTQFEQISAECGGCLEVTTVSGWVEGEKRVPERTRITNVIAIQRGTSDPNRVVIMSGDIDSRVSDVMDATHDAPGANDNASGLAGTLEAARLLSHHTFAATIVYAGLSGEEQGLFGGTILARHAQSSGWQVEAVLNNDMIGNIEGINGVIDNRTVRVFSEGIRPDETAQEARERRFTGSENDSPSRNLARYIKQVGEAYVPAIDVRLVYRLDRFGRGGHHRPFTELGMPGVRIMETWENYNRQHQDVRSENGIAYGDVISGVNFPYAAKLTALNAVTLAALAGAPAPVSGLTIDGAVSASTMLHWQALDAATNPQLAGYKIYWRDTSEPTWTHSRYIGNVTQFTLDNVIIDNNYFGVASVATDGRESPIVFPGSGGAFFRQPQEQ